MSDEPRRVLVGKRYVDDEILHLTTLLNERAKALALALEMQAAEYERRLEDLNNAHARAIEAARSTVPRELYDAGRREEALRREELAGRVQETKDSAAVALATLREEVGKDINFRAGEAKSKATTMAVLISAGGAAVSILASWLLK